MNLKYFVTVSVIYCSFTGGFIGACGTDNVFEPAVKKTNKDKGQKDLANGNYDAAITNLTEYVKSHPDDADSRSMLASALLKKSGLNEIDLATKVSENGSDWKSITAALPAGTSDNQARLELAVSTLAAIPAAKRTPEQSYQLALTPTSLAITIVKKVAGDENGKITNEKVDSMSDDDANKILASLNGCKETMITSGLVQTNPAASKLGTLTDKISATPGASDADKLRAYLKNNK